MFIKVHKGEVDRVEHPLKPQFARNCRGDLGTEEDSYVAWISSLGVAGQENLRHLHSDCL